MTSEKSKRRHLGRVKTVMLQHAMPWFCLILGCSNDKKRRPALRFRRIPKVITIKVNRANFLSTDPRSKWLAICREKFKNILDSDRVSGIHFIQSKPLTCRIEF